uniref:Uncharacterized protein n=1 Tax=viral metagenome TaxID=1070528 RepID=A0A6M3LBP3_9ZZZZ
MVEQTYFNKEMKFSKRIPARTETIYFNWCRKEFLIMSPEYRKARAKMLRPMDTCFWCKYKFKDGDIMALAQPKKGLNKMLCNKCADLLIQSA